MFFGESLTMRITDGIVLVPHFLTRLVAIFGFSFFSVTAACAQDADAEVEMSDEEAEAQTMAMVETFGWEREGSGNLGSQATIEIPEGYRFTGRSGTEKLMQLFGNQPSPSCCLRQFTSRLTTMYGALVFMSPTSFQDHQKVREIL